MNTCANFLVVTQDNKVLQYYVPCKGNPSSLGERLRQKILQSLGLLVLDPNKPLLDCFLGSIKDMIYDGHNGYWEKEKDFLFNDPIQIHSDINYLYIVNLNMHYPDILYCTLMGKFLFASSNNKNLIDVVCIKENAIPLGDILTEKNEV